MSNVRPLRSIRPNTRLMRELRRPDPDFVQVDGVETLRTLDVHGVINGGNITDEMLLATFGPQWEPISALVRRAANLTPDEAEHLNAAWDAAWNAALDAAWNAARNAARNAAWNAAWDVAWDVARDAVWALVVRDLVGQHGLSQDHYDTLTRPWATLIGPAHPDDKAVAA